MKEIIERLMKHAALDWQEYIKHIDVADLDPGCSVVVYGIWNGLIKLTSTLYNDEHQMIMKICGLKIGRIEMFNGDGKQANMLLLIEKEGQ